MMQMRTHTCNELRLGDVGKQVKFPFSLYNRRERERLLCLLPSHKSGARRRL